MVKILKYYLAGILSLLTFSPVYSQQNVILGLDCDEGSQGKGRLFSIDSTFQQVNTLHSFEYIEGIGNWNYSDLVQASNGKFYGVGVINDRGTNVIFEYNVDSNKYKIVQRIGNDLGTPFHGLTKHPNGLLYGVCSYGTLAPYGLIYSFDPQTYTFNQVHLFASQYLNPNSTLTVGKNNKLYGSIDGGGAGYPTHGGLYEYDLITNTFTSLHTFTGFYHTNNTNLIDGPDSCIYGIREGYSPTSGRLYKFNYMTKQYTLLYNINSSVHYSQDFNNLILNDNHLYATSNAGMTGASSIFHFDLSNSNIGVDHYYQFTPSTHGTSILGNLCLNSEGDLIGAFSHMGPNNIGSLFKMDSLLNLEALYTPFSRSKGLYNPSGRFILKNDSQLIGFNLNSAVPANGVSYINKYRHGLGNIYTYNIIQDSIRSLIQFGSSELGHIPINNLMHTGGNDFIICNRRGGRSFAGTILNYNIQDRKITKLYDVDSSMIDQVNTIRLVSSNLLVGTGTKNGFNKVFEFDLINYQMQVLDSFVVEYQAFNRRDYQLFQASNQKFYGVNDYIQVSSDAFIFEYDPSTSAVSQVYDLGLVNIKEISPEFVEFNQKLYASYETFSNTTGILVYNLNNQFVQLIPYNGSSSNLTSGAPWTLHSNGKMYSFLKVGNHPYTCNMVEFDPLASANQFSVKSNLFNYESQSNGKFVEAANGNLYFKSAQVDHTLYASSDIRFLEYNVQADSVRVISQNNSKWNGSSLNNFIYLNNTIIGLEETLAKNELNIYPNPTSEVLQISSLGNMLAAEIYSFDGKLIRRLSANQRIINVSQLQNGIYILKVKTSDAYLIERFVVSK